MLTFSRLLPVVIASIALVVSLCKSSPAEISARSITLIDEAGNVRVTILADATGGSVMLHSNGSNVTLSTATDSAGMIIEDKTARRQF